MEIWKDIQGYEGLYRISTYGKIRSVDRIVKMKGKTPQKKVNAQGLKPNKSSGYYWICLKNEKHEPKYCLIHRLVAASFLLNDDCLPEVNHKDGNKLNNHVENLEWCSRSHNTKHALATGLRTIPRHTPVVDTLTGDYYNTIVSAANSIGIKPQTLVQYLNGSRTNKTSFKYA